MAKHDPLATATRLLAFYQKAADKAGVTFPCLQREGDPMTATTDGDQMTLRISGPLDPWFGVTSKALTEAIDKEQPKSLLLQITSPGGLAFEGLNMYSALASYKRDGMEINSEAQGLVASAAVMPFLAGDERTINEGSLIMVHEPFGGIFAFGTADEILSEAQKAVNALNAIDGEYSSIAAKRTNISRKQMAEWLRDETWFNSAEAVKHGFAHEAVEGQADEPDAEVVKQARAAQASFLLGL